jgi:hypothetical protein
MADLDYMNGFWYVDEAGGLYIISIDGNIKSYPKNQDGRIIAFYIESWIFEKKNFLDPLRALYFGLKIVPQEKRGYTEEKGYFIKEI